MVSEVVQELPGHHQYGVKELLYLGVGEYLLDEVYGPLDLKVVSWLLPFDDQGGAHHMVPCHDVEEEGFSLFRSDEDWG